MAGHSKWHNIKHKKQKEDRRRAKLFSKLVKKITVAAREGGGDPEVNNDLELVIQKAKDANMPKENIERAIKRGTGELEGVNYESYVYEGYAPAGVALYMEVMTDNKNRTVSEVRHLLSEHGGNLGEDGCVAWMFERKGQLIIDRSDYEVVEDEAMMAAIEAGAEDIKFSEDTVEILTNPEDLQDVRKVMEEEGYQFSSGDLVMLPDNEITLDDPDDAKKVLKLMDKLEDHDDIQDVYANFNLSEDVIAEISDEI
ncbi:DNA-binding regulatory protein, YebC/PmpR family [Halobacteroides halobius DSM 5150]|uniref:Probable transcriptional regulatory protein Halha_1862 n=1 Tax=Halobacteroides halobius (strain ATCC 35273 / DSM 5150 / MD-1) TaxID=748449 RepID=L0KB70_HALHC|nr:YebC/PmpR family DNA-binding transcriptional regulator [Halobacteroides halobius]AGB41775.1 DNA-binding regulatory protein, YebC/PmpR family [Halobacteroides halobius DSM 5150]